MIYTLPSLPYEYSALEPHIDAKTMEIHHTKHHAGYVSHLNKLLEGVETLVNKTLEEIIVDIRLVPEEIRQGVRNNGGGHLNHSLFWHIMGPGCGGASVGVLSSAIDAEFGGFAGFKDRFTQTALSRFGSGWIWLCVDARGRLEILDTPNQDSPLMQGNRPILGLDVWEHAYYLKYHNRRVDYVQAWWNVVNWKNVDDLYMHNLELVSRQGHPK